MEFLEQTGSENVTKKFEMIMLFGFISNLIYLCFQIIKMNMTRRGKHSVDVGMVCLEVMVAATWITQFIMLLTYRFSHTGYVCSGDFAEDQMIRSLNTNGKVVQAELDQYNQYYISNEGDFLYFYVWALVAMFIIFFVSAICMGSCLFFLGSATSLQLVEQTLKEFDKIPEMMKEKAAKAAQKAQPKNDDPFKTGKADDDESAFKD